MKRKILGMLLIFSLVFVFGACSPDDDMYDFDDTEETEIESGLDSEPAIDSEYADLELLREDPTEDDDYGFFLLRNGTNYTLGTVIHNEYAPSGDCMIYDNIVEINDSGLRGFCSVGYVPVPVLQDGDSVVCYSDEGVPTLGLAAVDLYGYTTGVIYYPKDGVMYYCANTATGEWVNNKNVSDLTITDSEGNIAEDIHNLNENQSYTVSWYEGTQYQEASLVADSKMYIFHNSEYEKDYEIEGSLTKNGYAEYDLSGVAAGTYKISVGPGGAWEGLITIE